MHTALDWSRNVKNSDSYFYFVYYNFIKSEPGEVYCVILFISTIFSNHYHLILVTYYFPAFWNKLKSTVEYEYPLHVMLPRVIPLLISPEA